MTMKTYISLVLVSSIATIGATSIAIIDMEQISQTSEYGKIITQKMKAEEQKLEQKIATDKKNYEETQTKIQKIEADIKKLQDELQKQEKVLTAEAKQAKIDKILSLQEEGQVLVNKLGRLERQLRQQGQALQQEFAATYEKYMKELQDFLDRGLASLLERNKEIEVIIPKHLALKHRAGNDYTTHAITELNKITAEVVRKEKVTTPAPKTAAA